MANPNPSAARELDDLSDGDLLVLRNAAIAHGQAQFADAMEQARKNRAAPELRRHSRRRT